MPGLNVLCAPYHLYTHRKEFERLFVAMHERGWLVDVCLPFTEKSTLLSMADSARQLPYVAEVHDLTPHRLIAWPGETLARAGRALALLIYFVRAGLLLWRQRPDVLLLTSDLGGVSVRFLQLICRRWSIPIVTLQTTLFLKVAEREDLKFEFRPRWLNHLLSKGVFKQLFLFFGDVPGTFLPQSYLAVQDEEIQSVCHEFGKPWDRMIVVGSLQQAMIVEMRRQLTHRDVSAPSEGRRPTILFLTECVEERFGIDMARRHLSWMRMLQASLGGACDLMLRFHPRESQSYRAAALAELGDAFVLDLYADPTVSVARADVVIGAFSMLLFDAQSAGARSVFLDVGCDPIGFYSARRQPIARDGVEVCRLVAQALQQESVSLDSALNGGQWAQSVLNWIEGLTPLRR